MLSDRASVVPRLYLLDDQGNLILEGPTTYVDESGDEYDQGLWGEMKVMIPKDGAYDLIVSADNSGAGDVVGTLKNYKPAVYDKNGKTVEESKETTKDVVASPTGKVELRIKEKR